MNPINKHCKLAIIVMIMIGLTVLGSLSCSRGAGQVESLRVGVLKDLTAGPAVISDSNSFFAANGLNVSFSRFETGDQANSALASGTVDIAYMSEYIMVRNVFEKQPVSIIACDSKYEGVLLAARKSRGINSVADLKGKKIGVAMRTVNFFYLGRLMERNGIRIQDVITIDGSQPTLIDMFNREELDAVIFSRIWVNQLEPQSDVVSWPAQSRQPGYRVVVARTDWIESHRDLVLRYLKAINAAEDFIIDHPVEAKAIIREQPDLGAKYMDTEWPVTYFGLSLDLSLVAAMNDEADWMISAGLTSEKAIPDFAAHFYIDGLKAVKPEAVNVVH